MIGLQINMARAARAIEIFGSELCEQGYRSALIREPAPLIQHDVALAIRWLESCAVERTSLRSGQGSYSLKHRVEEFFAQLGQHYYLGNGCLIAGALATGLPVRATGINAQIGIRALIPAQAWFT